MSVPAPKRDKFAALAAKQSAAADPPPAPANEDTTATASNLAGSTATTTTTTTTPPKRDKFASLAAAAASSSSSSMAVESTAVAASTMTPSGETQKINLGIPRRDKFAAVQQQKTVHDREQKKKVVQERCQQRDSVWDELDEAEATVLQVLQLAQQTAQVLAHKTTEEHFLDNDDEEDAEEEEEGPMTPQLLRSLAVDYQKGVSKIHRLLSSHASHVVPYEASTATNRLYLQRVEHRIALSKRALLQQLVQEAKEEEPSIGASNSEQVASLEEDGTATTTGTTKRKREEIEL